MAVNRYTAKLIIAQAEKTYYSRNGNSYKAIKVFDKKKNFRGYVVYQLHNDMWYEIPEFVYFQPKRIPEKNKRDELNYEIARNIIKRGEKPFTTLAGNTYIPLSLFDKKNRPHGNAIYKKINKEKRWKFVYYIPQLESSRKK